MIEAYKSTVSKSNMSPIDIFVVIISNLRLLILGPFISGLIAFGITFLVTPIFTARTTLLPPSQSTLTGANAILGQLGGVMGSGLKTPADQLVAYLESNNLQDKMIETFNLKDRYQQVSAEAARRSLRSHLRVNSDKKTGLINIEVDDYDPKFAAVLANGYVVALGQMMGEISLGEAKGKRETLEKQISEAMEKTYQSPIVKEVIIQTLIREYETTRLQEKKGPAYVTQIDVAFVPERASKPQKALIAVSVSLAVSFILLLYVFIVAAWGQIRSDDENHIKLQNLYTLFKEQIGR
jgi:uncharacterized protein involved in exopolysaccharide biosynthesis